MLVRKFVIYDILNIDGQVLNKDQKLELNITENSGNYLVHKDISRHRVLSKQRTSSTKTRSEVEGGGRKPWKQKGTGRARAGSNTSPLWKGGGVIFGPKPIKKRFKINKKERRLALQTLLYNRRNNISIVSNLEESLTTAKTKRLIEILRVFNISVEEKVLIIVSKKSKNLLLSGQNLKNVEIILASNLNSASLLKTKQILITNNGFNDIKEIYCD